MIDEPLLELKNLKSFFFTEEGVARAVDEVSFSINPGEVFGLVGESGCGKTVTAGSLPGSLRGTGGAVAISTFQKGDRFVANAPRDDICPARRGATYPPTTRSRGTNQ